MIKNGTIILVHNPFNWRDPMTYLGYIIRKISNTYWNHCAIVVDQNGIFYVVEATYPRIKITAYNVWVGLYERKTQLINIDHNLDEAILKARIVKHLGVKYDLLSLAVHLPLFLFTRKWWGSKSKRGIDKPYCFELVAWIYDLPNWFNIFPNEFVEITTQKQTKKA